MRGYYINNYGFTLTELLASIGVLALIVAIALPTYFSIRNNILEKSYSNVVSYIETAAEKYASETGTKITNVDTLVKEGVIGADDDSGNIYDPRDNSVINCYLIEIGEENGEYSANLIDTPVTNSDGTCNADVIDNSVIKMFCNGEECKDSWYGDDLLLSVGNIDLSNASFVSYSWSNLTGFRSDEETINVEAENRVVNTTYSVTLKVDDKIYSVNQVIKIDKENPSILNSTNLSFSNRWAPSKTLTIKASDMAGSGIKGYYYGIESQSCSDDINDYVDNNLIKFNELGTNTYKYCVMDNVGNFSESTIVVDKIDPYTPVKPDISSSDGLDQTAWHTTDFNLTFSSTNEQSVSSITYFYGTDLSNIYQDGTIVSVNSNLNGETIYVKACNEAGTCSEVNSYKIKYDNTPPSYVSGGSLGAGSISKPTYQDNNKGSGGVSVFTCVSTGNVISNTDTCFSSINTNYSYSCGTTYKLYSYAMDEAGNKSAVYSHTNSNYYNACYTNSGGGSSSSKNNNTVVCDATCQMKENSEKWWDIENDNSMTETEKKAEQEKLHNANVLLSNSNTDCKGSCNFTNSNGVWTDSNDNKLYTVSGGNKTTTSSNKTSSTNNSSSSSSSSKSSSSKSSNVVTNAISNIVGSITKLFR